MSSTHITIFSKLRGRYFWYSIEWSLNKYTTYCCYHNIPLFVNFFKFQKEDSAFPQRNDWHFKNWEIQKKVEMYDFRYLLLSFVDTGHTSWEFSLLRQWAIKSLFKYPCYFTGFISILIYKPLTIEHLWTTSFSSSTFSKLLKWEVYTFPFVSL